MRDKPKRPSTAATTETNPANEDTRLRPRRFKWWDAQWAVWSYGCYFFSINCSCIECVGGLMTKHMGAPDPDRLTAFAWLDEEQP